MRSRTLLSLASLLLFVLVLTIAAAADSTNLGGANYGRANSGNDEWLIAVEVRSTADVERFEQTALPLFIRFGVQGSEYLLTRANGVERSSLEEMGLRYRVLGDFSEDRNLYLAYAGPGRTGSEWNGYARVLLAHGDVALVELSHQEAELLSAAGAELQLVTFAPKPLWPQVERLDTSATIPDPFVQSLMAQVFTTTVESYDGGLSGEWPVTIGGSPYTIVTRHTNSVLPIQKATEYVGEHLANLGLNVEYHQWGAASYPNVIGEITGQGNPSDVYIIMAHLDDMPSGPLAPGADDNASGSTAILIAADIFSQYSWDCTLRFALWTGEEQGLLGSYAYAQRAYNSGENILGALNLDMIGWNTSGSSPDFDLHARSSDPATLALAQLFSDVVTGYQLNLVPQIVNNGTGASDHASFWQFGFPAILGIEDYYGGGDFNPYYHTTQDLLAHLDLDYFTNMVKASVGTFAHMSDCLAVSDPGYLQGAVTADDNGLPISGATVDTRSAGGWLDTTSTSASGTYSVTLPAGTYTVAVSALGYLPAIATGVSVVTDTITVQDFALVRAHANYYPVVLNE